MAKGYHETVEELKHKALHDIETKDISNVQLSLISQKDLSELDDRGALFIVENRDYNDTMTGLHDPMMGTIQSNKHCARCGNDMWKCQGHYGYIKLERKIIHPLYIKIVSILLNLFSDMTYEENGEEWYTLIPPDDSLTPYRNLSYFQKLKTIHDELVKNKYKVKGYDIFFFSTGKKGEIGTKLYPDAIEAKLAKFNSKDLEKIGICGVRPENFILRFIPVIPVAMRPYNTIKGFKAHDITIAYSKIIKANQDFHNSIDPNKNMDAVSEAYEKLIEGDSSCSDKVEVSSITKVLNGKKGLFRTSIEGKRGDFTARAVAGPDPFIAMDEIGLPLEYQKMLTTKETVVHNETFSNLEHIKNLILKGEVKSIAGSNEKKILITQENRSRIANTIKVGNVISRYIREGDIIVLFRFPSLHKHSMISGKARFLPSKTIRIHPSVAEGLNEDFDGDENNIVIPQSYLSKGSVQELINVKNCIISEKTSKPIVGLSQDFIIGALKLSLDTTFLGKEKFSDLILLIDKESSISDLKERLRRYGVPEYSGKALISSLLPRNMKFNNKMKDNEVIIMDGILMKGVLTKEILSDSSNSITQHLYRYYGEKITSDFITGMGRIAIVYITMTGFSLGYEDCIVDPSKQKRIQETISKSLKEIRDIKKTDDPVLAMKKEVEIISRLGAIRDMVGRIVIEKDNHKVIDIPPGSTSVTISYVDRTLPLNVINIIPSSEEAKYLNYKFSDDCYLNYKVSSLGLTIVGDEIILPTNTSIRIFYSDGGEEFITPDKKSSFEIVPFELQEGFTTRTEMIVIEFPSDKVITSNGIIQLTDVDAIEVDYTKKMVYAVRGDEKHHIQGIGAKTLTIKTPSSEKVISLIEEENPFHTMILSKAKGSAINLTQLSGIIGPQGPVGGRVPLEITNNTRVIPHFNVNDEDPTSQGFCGSSYAGGLTPIEMYMHFLATREGLTDSSTKTSDTGYLQRRLWHFMENMKSEQDGSIRDINKNIIQFLYGGTGYDPSFGIVVNDRLTFTRISTLILNLPSSKNKSVYIFRVRSDEDAKEVMIAITILLSQITNFKSDIIVFIDGVMFNSWYPRFKIEFIEVLYGYPSTEDLKDFESDYDKIILYK